MRVRNLTGIPQGLSGYSFPVGKWLQVPAEVPFKVAIDAHHRRIVEIVTDNDDETLWKEEDGTHIMWLSPLSVGDGYGTAAENMVLALERLGLNVHIRHCWFGVQKGINPHTIEMLERPLPGPLRVGVCMATPGEFGKLPTPYRIGITMYEADNPLVPHPEWQHDCKNADMLIVPSQYCKDVFAQFFNRRIEICPLAVNPVYYTAQKREPKDTFTFVTYGTLSGRKAPLETLELFKRVFPRDKYPDVRMEFKTRLGVFGWGERQLPPIDDDRITIHNTMTHNKGTPDWTSEVVRDWLHRADCMLFLSKGEGFGMPPREAMATGLPVIFAKHTGMETMACEYNWPVPTGKLEKSPLGGDWRLADWDYAAECMKWVYEHREKAYDRGVKAAKWFIEKHGSEAVAKQLFNLIENLDPVPVRGNVEKTEKPGKLTFLRHKPFYDAIKQTVLPPAVVWDIGWGTEGALYSWLVKEGYKAYAVVPPGTDTKGAKTIYAEPFELNNLGAKAPDLIVCQGVLQRYTYKEVQRLIGDWLRLSPVLFSAPTVYYPDWFEEGAKLRRQSEWMDMLVGVEAETHYYKNKQYMWGHAKGVATRAIGPVVFSGRVTDGVWRPVAEGAP